VNALPLSKENILDAAEQVLRRFGPDKTSVVDVAKVLKVSHGTLYRHFSSKVALREAVTERWLYQNILAPLKDVTEQFDGNAKAQLRMWLDTLIRNITISSSCSCERVAVGYDRSGVCLRLGFDAFRNFVINSYSLFHNRIMMD
jgi:AcrR family transcriptional regulator